MLSMALGSGGPSFPDNRSQGIASTIGSVNLDLVVLARDFGFEGAAGESAALDLEAAGVGRPFAPFLACFFLTTAKDFPAVELEDDEEESEEGELRPEVVGVLGTGGTNAPRIGRVISGAETDLDGNLDFVADGAGAFLPLGCLVAILISIVGMDCTDVESTVV